jgi:hypothetical protein
MHVKLGTKPFLTQPLLASQCRCPNEHTPLFPSAIPVYPYYTGLASLYRGYSTARGAPL